MTFVVAAKFYDTKENNLRLKRIFAKITLGFRRTSHTVREDLRQKLSTLNCSAALHFRSK